MPVRASCGPVAVVCLPVKKILVSYLEVVLLFHSIGEDRAVTADDETVDSVDVIAALDLHVAELTGREIPTQGECSHILATSCLGITDFFKLPARVGWLSPLKISDRAILIPKER